MKKILLAVYVFAALAVSAAHTAIVITEVNPTGSSNAVYGADWFELTNTGAAAVDITGWKVDDTTPTFATAVALRGLTSIGPGQSVVFAEGNTSGSNDATIKTNFIQSWFGGSAPAGFTMGGYGGSGIGLSSSGDALTIYDSTQAVVFNVTFGATTTGISLDNKAGLSGAISQNSVAGVNGAFAAGGETGSPGTIGVPEPATLSLIGMFAAVLARAGAKAKVRRNKVA